MDLAASQHASIANTPPLTRLLLAVAITLGLVLSVLHPSATRLLVWPWAAFATLAWLLPVAVVLRRALRTDPFPRFGGCIDLGLALLAGTAVASALASPFRSLALVAALPVISACAMPYALLPFFPPACARKAFTRLGAIVVAILIVSLFLWLHARDWRGWPSSRNDFPFGHSNILGSVGVLATSWLAACAAIHTGRIRAGFVAATALAIVVALSSESRGAVLALLALFTVAAGHFFLRRGRLLLFITFIAAALGVALATNARLRQFVVHREWSPAARASNDQRTAMLLGGLQLGVERPLLGWGPGTIPHVFPRVRATLPGTADNIVQLHNSPAQTFATLGATGLLGLTLLALGLLAPLGEALRPDQRPDARKSPAHPWLAAGLVGGAVLLLFDHPFAVPAFTALATAHLAACRAPFVLTSQLPSARARRIIALLTLAALGPVLFGVTRDLTARAAYASALDAVALDDRVTFVTALQRASAAMPADPYYRHQLAAHHVTGHPFPAPHPASPADSTSALDALNASLDANPDLEYARYNLGWLLLDTAPADSARHLLDAARLAPQRGAVYFGLGLARLRLSDRDAAIRAFAAEWLNDPSFAWSEVWFNSTLAPLRPAILELASAALPPADPRSVPLSHAWSVASSPAPVGAYFRRIRTGYGVLMGHPDGPPPPDFNIQTTITLPADIAALCPDKGWLPGGFLLEFLTPSPR